MALAGQGMPFTRPRHTQGSNMQHGSITTQPITGVLLLSPVGKEEMKAQSQA